MNKSNCQAANFMGRVFLERCYVLLEVQALNFALDKHRGTEQREREKRRASHQPLFYSNILYKRFSRWPGRAHREAADTAAGALVLLVQICFNVARIYLFAPLSYFFWRVSTNRETFVCHASLTTTRVKIKYKFSCPSQSAYTHRFLFEFM